MVKLTKEQRIWFSANTRAYKADIRQRVLAMLGSKCVRCGFSDWRALQVDHIKHVGQKNRESWSAQANRILQGDTEGYQLLCANCNWIKKHENREFNIKYFELEEKPLETRN